MADRAASPTSGGEPTYHDAQLRMALEQSERRLSEVQLLAHIGHFEHDLLTDRATASEEVHRIFGSDPGRLEVDTARLLTFVHPDDRPLVQTAIAGMAAGHREEDEVRYRVVRPDGGVRFVHARCRLRRDPPGTPARVFGTVQDVTERELSARRYEAILNTAPECVKLIGPDGALLEMNAAGLRMLEVGSLDEAQAGFESFVAPEHLPAFRALAQRVFAGASDQLEFECIGAKGGHRWLLTRATPLRDAAGGVIALLAVTRDITERKHAEQALRESEQRFREVTENIEQVFWLSDRELAEILYVSPAYERVWGRSCQSLYDSPGSWLEAIHEDDYERVREAAFDRETQRRYDIEYRVVRPDGSLRWIRDRAFPIRDASGKVTRFAGLADDISAYRALEEQLRQSQKMDAVGRLAGGVAHDFNNMLAVIQMQASLLSQMGGDPRLRQGIEQISAAAERAAGLTRQLLAFSRRQVKQPRAVDLRDVVADMTKLLFRLLGEDVAIEHRFATELPKVLADPAMMELAFMNLAVNARDAMPRGGRLEVAVDAVMADHSFVAAHPRAEAGTSYVRLRVSDTGVGIAPEDRARIFEPFFTTKEVGKGTGLGLATVFGIVEQHDGFIDVTSERGRGTTFTVLLPALAFEEVEAEAEAPSTREANGTETILLVEDEAAVRRLARMVLEGYGYRVLEATCARDALDRFATHADEVDLVITDLVMPGPITGHDLVRELHARRPALKVICMSGYSQEALPEGGEAARHRTFLQKPFTSDELALVVRRCLT